MQIISYTDKDEIKQQIMEKYEEYRSEYGSPRSRTQIWNMIDFVIEPLLDKLTDWDAAEKSAQSKLEEISQILG